MEIRLHFSMLLSLPIAYYLFEPVKPYEYVIALLWLAGFTACILLHELGHALAARLFGVEVKSVVIWLLGGFTNLSRRAEKPMHNLAIAAAGPLVNMGLAFFCVAAYVGAQFLAPRSVDEFIFLQALGNLLFSLALVNLILIFFNLLPVYPLDGGNILHSFVETFLGKASADLITLIVGIPILLCLLAFGVIIGDYLLVFSCLLIGLGLAALNRSLLRKINLAANYLFRRGGYHYLLEDFDRAAQIYSAEIDRNPQDPGNYVARAVCSLNLMQSERAKADVERALHLAPNHILALQLRGELYMMEKDYARALEYFDRTLRLNPNWGVAYFDRGSVMMDQKEYSSALAEFNRAIALMPQHYLFYLIRSTAHFRLGALEAARRDEDEALRLDDRNALVMSEFNLIVYDGFLDWAEDYYGRVIAKNNRQLQSWGQAPAQLGYAYRGRGDAYRRNGLYAEAIQDYSAALQIAPKEAHLYLARGKARKALGETEEAKADLQAVLALTEKTHLKRQANELLRNL